VQLSDKKSKEKKIGQLGKSGAANDVIDSAIKFKKVAVIKLARKLLFLFVCQPM
jgi:hypothetical protein